MLVERWHFRMLNDNGRNSAYRQAIQKAIKQGSIKRILDIGTGTGLLSLYALQAGVNHVDACEKSEIMLEIAENVFKLNGFEDKVNLVPKYSTEIRVGHDIDSKIPLIVTEIFDSGIFGEGVLQTLRHAREHLLEDDGRIIPSKVEIFISGYQSEKLAFSSIVLNESFYDYLFLDNHKLVARKKEYYDADDVRLVKDFKLVTNCALALSLDLNDGDSVKAYLAGQAGPKVKLTCQHDGYIDGFCIWFHLYLDDENVIKTSPTSNTCWNQALIKLDHRHAVEQYNVFYLKLSCGDGILRVSHDMEQQEKYLEVDDEIIKFINDAEYLNQLEHDVINAFKQKKREKVEIILDFCIFPYIGLMLLKEKRSRVLYCSQNAEQLIKFATNKNCLNENNIKFIKSPMDLLVEKLTFDLIILSPFDSYGQLRSEQITDYQNLKLCLKPNGIIVPHAIELHGEVIHSDWLLRACRVTDPEVKSLHIADLINLYATENHLELSNLFYVSLCLKPFLIGNIYLDGELHENKSSIMLKRHLTPPIAVLYWYKIRFVDGCEPLGTNSRFSHIPRAAFITTVDGFENTIGLYHLIFLQNQGVIQLGLKPIFPETKEKDLASYDSDSGEELVTDD